MGSGNIAMQSNNRVNKVGVENQKKYNAKNL
jgi:hypothetical protein